MEFESLTGIGVNDQNIIFLSFGKGTYLKESIPGSDFLRREGRKPAGSFRRAAEVKTTGSIARLFNLSCVCFLENVA